MSLGLDFGLPHLVFLLFFRFLLPSRRLGPREGPLPELGLFFFISHTPC